MALIGTLGVKLEALTAGFNRGMDNAVSKVEESSARIESVTSKAKGAFIGLSGAIGLSVAALGRQQTAERRLEAVANIYGTNTEVVEDYAAALQEVTTFGDEATISGAAMLQSFALTEDQLLTLIPRMQNLAAFTGGDLNAAAMLLGKAVTTSASALSEAGIILDDTQKKAFEAADQMGRVALVAEIVDANVGNAAETMAKTATGAFAQLTNAAGDVLEQFGSIVESPLVDIFNALKTALGTVTAFFKTLSPTTKRFLGIAVLVVTALSGLVAVVGSVALALPGIAAGLSAVGGALAVVALPLLGIILKVALFGTAIVVARKIWVDNVGGIQDKAQAVADWFSSKWSTFVENLELEWIDMSNALSSAWSAVTGFIAKAISKALTFVSSAFKRIRGAALKALRAISPEAADAVEAFTDMGEAGSFVGEKWKQLKTTASGALDALNERIGRTTETLESVAETAEEVYDGVTEAAGDAAGFVVDSWVDAASSIGEALGLTGDDLEAFTEKLKGKAAAPKVTGGDGGTTKDKVETRDALEGAIDSFKEAAPELAAATTSFASGLSGSLGKIGDLIQTTVDAGLAGGPYAAAGAALAKLASNTESFGKIVEQLDGVFQLLVGAVDPLVQIVAAVLTPVLNALELAVRGITVVLTALSIAFGYVVNFIIDVAGEILNLLVGLADLVGAGGELRRFANQLRNARVDVEGMQDSLAEAAGAASKTGDELLKTSKGISIAGQIWIDMLMGGGGIAGGLRRQFADFEETTVETADTLEDLNDAGEQAAETFREAAAALTNVPSGFKLAAARFDAISTSFAPGGGVASVLGAGAGSSTVTSIENLFVTSDDPEAFLEKLQDAAAWQNFTSSGTPIDTPPDPNKR